MNFENCVSFSCIEVTQPVGTFYIGSINYKDLIEISYADIRRIEREEKREVEKYLGIQRPLSNSRVKELIEYVSTIDATFPTSVIIAVSSNDARFDKNKKIMNIRRAENVAKIIDGQHRIAGIKGFIGDTFQFNVTVFVEMDIEDQAMVFATINLKQTKVSKSLAYDLYEFSKSRSPQKTCHNIAKLLNHKEGSPFWNKIKILGVATGKPEESITQATMVDRLIRYISAHPMKDRDQLKRGKSLNKATGKQAQKLIFRNLFIDERDAEIAKNLWNYFKAVEKKWPNAWPETKRGNILNRTTGFAALMRFLRDIYVHYEAIDRVVPMDKYFEALRIIELQDNEFTPENFKPGSSGEGELYRRFLKLSGIRKQGN